MSNFSRFFPKKGQKTPNLEILGKNLLSIPLAEGIVSGEWGVGKKTSSAPSAQFSCNSSRRGAKAQRTPRCITYGLTVS